MDSARYKILLVEDDKLDQMAFLRMAEKQEIPYDCKVAGSVAQAKEILQTDSFDIVILDHNLGDGTGFDVLDFIHDTPVVFVTGGGDEEIAINAWKAGADDYIVKDHEGHYLKTLPITIENTVKHSGIAKKLHLLSYALVCTEDSVYITDLAGKITFVNKAFKEIYGYSEKEILGKDCNILWDKNPSNEHSQDDYDVDDGWEVAFFHERKDGSKFPVFLSRSDVVDEKGDAFAVVVVTRDISERMSIENELRNANKELEKQGLVIKGMLEVFGEDILKRALAKIEDKGDRVKANMILTRGSATDNVQPSDLDALTQILQIVGRQREQQQKKEYEKLLANNH